MPSTRDVRRLKGSQNFAKNNNVLVLSTTHMFKQIMIPVAAFAVTVTGASAFGGGMLENLDILSDNETAAFEEAREIRETANEEAKAVLAAAGIDENRMSAIHEAVRVKRQAHHETVEEALEALDYDAFLAAVEGTPMENVVGSQTDFEKFAEAHELRESGDYGAAKEIMEELGIERPFMKGAGKGGVRGQGLGGASLFGERFGAEAE